MKTETIKEIQLCFDRIHIPTGINETKLQVDKI